MPDEPNPAGADLVSTLNAALDGWNSAMGVRFVSAAPDEIVAEIQIGPVHRQPYGLVHGGVYAGLIETVTSVGAALDAAARDQAAVGLENSTSFLRAVRDGTLRATARSVYRGRRSQVWEATVVDDKGRVAATGRVRLLTLERDASVAGATVNLRPTPSAPSPAARDRDP